MNKATWFLIALGVVVGMIVSGTYGALADGDPTTDDVPRTLPYNGILELNGQPVNASGEEAILIEFALFDGHGAEAPTYTQQILVDVYAGRFTATIGPLGQSAQDEEIEITEVITAADDLYLGMTLLGDPENPDDDIALNNRQRIHASPYAMWTTSATNLDVAADLLVRGNATVGSLDVQGNAQVGGGMNVAGQTQAQGGLVVGERLVPPTGIEGIRWAPNPGGGSGDLAWIQYHIDGDGENTELQIGISNDTDDDIAFFQGGSNKLNIGSTVNINTDLKLPGESTINANNARGLLINCNFNGTRRVNGDGGVSDDIRFTCSNGVITDINMVAP